MGTNYSRRGDARRGRNLGNAPTRLDYPKGESEGAVRIYALLGDPAYARSVEFRQSEEWHAMMLSPIPSARLGWGA